MLNYGTSYGRNYNSYYYNYGIFEHSKFNLFSCIKSNALYSLYYFHLRVGTKYYLT